MGIALWHERQVHRPAGTKRPRKPNLDEMGPGVEAIPARDEANTNDREARRSSGPRSKTGRPGMRGGWRPRER
jgi:excinuclease ABC subunit B